MIRTHDALSALLLFAIVLCLGTATTVRGDTDTASKPSPWTDVWRDELRRGLRWRLHVLSFGIIQQPVMSRVNPNNTLDIPRYRLEMDLRPDLALTFRRLELSVKPRAEMFWQKWQDGRRDGDREIEAEVFVNEWFARLRLTNQLLVSYGRENLQWGPAALLSPSNPFNRNNGRNNPFVEVPGLDYGRVLWIPSASWSASFIANTGEGRLERLRDFERTYALKLDYTGTAAYFSLIPSSRESGDIQVGWFAGWTVSEALLLYTEGEVGEGIDTIGFLLGGAYTLADRGTITLEFFHQEDGCTRRRIDLCLLPSGGTADPADGLIRQNYVLVQYVETRIWSTMNVIVRWIRNLNDHSDHIISIVEYEAGDHVVLFAVSNVGVGDNDDEFGSVLTYSLMIGVNYTF